MDSTPAPRTPSTRFRRLGLEAGLAVPIGLLAGSASALFLWSLDRVTAARWHSPWLLWLLPVVGFAVGWIYLRFGQKAEQGTHLIMDEIHTPGGGAAQRQGLGAFNIYLHESRRGEVLKQSIKRKRRHRNHMADAAHLTPPPRNF